LNLEDDFDVRARFAAGEVVEKRFKLGDRPLEFAREACR
jgi:hypothetical protein